MSDVWDVERIEQDKVLAETQAAAKVLGVDAATMERIEEQLMCEFSTIDINEEVSDLIVRAFELARNPDMLDKVEGWR